MNTGFQLASSSSYSHSPSHCCLFIPIAVCLQVDEHSQHIRSLLHPAGTVMDLNIGAALWLAARAQGQRVLIPVRSSSSSADEPASNAAPSSINSSGSSSMWRLVPAEEALAAAAAGTSKTSGDITSSSANSSSCKCSQSSQSSVPYRYCSAARVVLLGHGADEQCGGYGRHRTRFRLASWQGLADELAVDVKRLWIRWVLV
jgi:asparagine synthetase B (glutamine-hydrolysing)